MYKNSLFDFYIYDPFFGIAGYVHFFIYVDNMSTYIIALLHDFKNATDILLF